MKKACWIVVILLVFGSLFLYNQPRSISRADSVELYLRGMFCGDFGYTLVGAKAASLDDSYSSEGIPSEDIERANAFLCRVFAQSDKFIFRQVNGTLWLFNKNKM